jgi:hypothetical protein
MKSTDWLCRVIDASTCVSSLLSEGAVSVRNAVAPNLVIFTTFDCTHHRGDPGDQGLNYKHRIWASHHFHRQLHQKSLEKATSEPSAAPRLPILGSALQLRDKSWLLSTDCKESFGEFADSIHREVLKCFYGKL